MRMTCSRGGAELQSSLCFSPAGFGRRALHSARLAVSSRLAPFCHVVLSRWLVSLLLSRVCLIFKLENLSPDGGVFSPALPPVEIRVDGEKCPHGRWRIRVLPA